MASFTTGLVDNPAVSGVRPMATLTVLIVNNDTLSTDVEIAGFYVSGPTKVQYVAEAFALGPGDVAIRNYYAQFDALEFQFDLTSGKVQVSLWGKDASGRIGFGQRILPQELIQA